MSVVTTPVFCVAWLVGHAVRVPHVDVDVGAAVRHVGLAEDGGGDRAHVERNHLALRDRDWHRDRRHSPPTLAAVAVVDGAVDESLAPVGTRRQRQQVVGWAWQRRCGVDQL